LITDINSSKFPNNYDDDASLTYIKAGETKISAIHLNQLRSSIIAIERALGVNPGAGMTVSQRLTSLTGEVSKLFRGMLNNSLVFAYDRYGFAAKAIFGEECNSWIVFDGNKKELANWPDTGREFEGFSCYDSGVSDVSPLSIVGNDGGGYRGRRVRIYDSLEVTKSFRMEKTQDSSDPSKFVFAGVMDAPWGMMTRGAFNRRNEFNYSAGLDGCGDVTEECVIDETSNWTLDCWVDYEIVRIGDPRYVNITGDCMNGDLRFGFGTEEIYGYGGTNGYPAAITFGFCEEHDPYLGGPYASIFIDPYGIRLSQTDGFFEYFVNETVGDTLRPLVISGSMATQQEYGLATSNRRRLKIIGDTHISGSARVSEYMYTGPNSDVNTKPNFTTDKTDPGYPKVYNGYIIDSSAASFSVPNYSSGFVGGGVTYGHRPGHTHEMADILDLDLTDTGPQVINIYDTFDTIHPDWAPRNESDHVKGRVVVNEGDLAKNMKIVCKRVHFNDSSGIYPMLVLKCKDSTQTYTHNTRNGYWSADTAVLEFDLGSSVPVGEYDAWLEDTTGLRGYSYFRNGGGIDVVSPLFALINHPNGSGSLQANVDYTFSATVSGGKQPYVNYEWNFGDGSLAAGDNPTPIHSYTTGGTYSVTLTVFDVNNFKYTTTRDFLVAECYGSVSLGYTLS